MKSAQNKKLLTVAVIALSVSACATTPQDIMSDGQSVDDEFVGEQRAALALATAGAGFGPQSPRDIDSANGENSRPYALAPDYTQMNLCNIHFHESAEHKGGEFTTFAGNGDGKGSGTGFLYSGVLSESELASTGTEIGTGKYGTLEPGDTIEVHYVHSSALVEPGATLGSCLSESILNPQLRVETQVYVLVNDANALDFTELTEIQEVNGYQQAVNIPSNTGSPIQYAGSTTGPGYNEEASPLKVSWSVRPEVAKVDINTVGTWLANNVFDETAAHGVRNLVVNPELLSTIE